MPTKISLSDSVNATISLLSHKQTKLYLFLCSNFKSGSTNVLESELKVDNPDSTFEKLIVSHQDMIHMVCNIYGQTAADREDLFQEITIQLWSSFSTFEHKSKFSTWLYRVALNTAISQKRKEKRNPDSISLSDMEMRIPDAVGTDTDEEDLQALQSAIRRLNAIDRAIIFLYLEEKSYQEIAEIIGITSKYVGIKLVRIKAKLLTILKTSYGK